MLNLYDILQEVINESVTPSAVVDAIKHKYQVIITYKDEKSRATKTRLIEPYVYGLSKSGNSVIRAYQYQGDTFRGIPKWKLFRLDRITSWKPTNSHFNTSPRERGWYAEVYNSNSDRSMSSVLNQVDFNDSDNPYDVGSDLYLLRQKTNQLKQSNPININQLSNNQINKFGPKNKKITKKIEKKNSSKFEKQLDQQLNITKFNQPSNTNTQNQRGPIVNDNNIDNIDQNVINNNTN